MMLNRMGGTGGDLGDLVRKPSLQQSKFKGLIDMFDGGGPGAAGDGLKGVKQGGIWQILERIGLLKGQ